MGPDQALPMSGSSMAIYPTGGGEAQLWERQ